MGRDRLFGLPALKSSVAPPYRAIIIIINFLSITLTCTAENLSGVMKSNARIYCYHGAVVDGMLEYDTTQSRPVPRTVLGAVCFPDLKQAL